jgi:hypothetical protein
MSECKAAQADWCTPSVITNVIWILEACGSGSEYIRVTNQKMQTQVVHQETQCFLC